MNQFVLDASVALAWFVDQTPAALAVRVRQMLVGGGRALVPFFWHLEVANGLLVAERRHLSTSDDTDEAVTQIEQLLLSVIETRGQPIFLRDAVSTARSYGIAPYDAGYLDLAREKRIPLATLDEKLRIAAITAGIAVIH